MLLKIIQLGPFGIIRMMWLGAQLAAAFRLMHKREPNENEWRVISWQAYFYAINKKKFL